VQVDVLEDDADGAVGPVLEAAWFVRPAGAGPGGAGARAGGGEDDLGNAPPASAPDRRSNITGGLTMVEDVGFVRDKNVAAVIDFRQTTIYPTDASPGQRPEHLVATDPRGRFHQVHHRAGNPEGTYEDDSPEYWREVTEALAPAAAILLLGHGPGKASASHHWVVYAEKHRRDVAAKVVADVRADIDQLDDTQVLRLAQYYFAWPLPQQR
jgi:hypothetical protein